MRTLSNGRKLSLVLALGGLVAFLLVASAGFADVVTRIEGESIPSSAFSGTWMAYSEPDLSNLNGIYSHTTNDTLTYPFSGTGVDWIAAIAPTCGPADVWVDNETAETITLYIATPAEYKKTVWSKIGLSDGPHTLHIRVAGTGNVNVDALDIHTPDPVVVSTPALSSWGVALLAGLGLVAVALSVSRRRTV